MINAALEGERQLTDWRTRNQRYRSGVMAAAGFRAGWDKALAYVRELQMSIDTMPVGELAGELRRREQSPLWPLFCDEPKFWSICDHCEQRELFDASGVCPNCNHEHV